MSKELETNTIAEQEELKDSSLQLTQLQEELLQCNKELEQYKQAYERLSTQYSNLWGLYSSMTDYVVSNTKRPS